MTTSPASSPSPQPYTRAPATGLPVALCVPTSCPADFLSLRAGGVRQSGQIAQRLASLRQEFFHGSILGPPAVLPDVQAGQHSPVAQAADCGGPRRARPDGGTRVRGFWLCVPQWDSSSFPGG